MDSVRKILVGGAVAIGMIVGVVSSAWAQDGTIRIGATLRMISDEGLRIGQMLVDQFKDLNEKGGINGKKVEVTLLNDECKPDVGVANALKLISDVKVHVLVGSTCSSVSVPIVDVTARAGVPQLTPSSTSSEVTIRKSAWIFRTSVSERFYGGIVGKFVGDTVGKKVAYVCSNDEASKSWCQNMIAFIKKTYGVDPVFVAQASEQNVDYRVFLLRIKALLPDAIAYSGVAAELGRMISQTNDVGIPTSITRVAQSNASIHEFVDVAGEDAKGLIFPAGFSPFDERPIVRQFVEMTKTRYGVPLPDHDFSQAWDLIQILKTAFSNAKLALTSSSLTADRTSIRDTLTKIKGYEGLASGPISFCADPTPQCRDGNRTPILIQYTKGGQHFEQKVYYKYTFPADFGL